MNTEQAYIKVNNPDKIIELVYQRLNGNLCHFPTLLFRETISRNEMEWKYVQKEK